MSKTLQLVVYGTANERTLNTGKLPELDRFVLEPIVTDTLCSVQPINHTELPSPYRNYVITTLHVGPARTDLMLVNYTRPVMIVTFRDQVKPIHHIQGQVEPVTDRLVNLHHKNAIALLMLVDTEKNTETVLDSEGYKNYLHERLTPEQYKAVYRNIPQSVPAVSEDSFKNASKYLGGERW